MSIDRCEVEPKKTAAVTLDQRAGTDGSHKWTFAASASSIVSAILASACCVGPLILALLGIGGGALLAKFEPYRPYFMVVTFALLGAGFYFAYRTPAGVIAGAPTVVAGVAGGDDCACPAPRSRRTGKVMLWVATVMVAAFLAFPYLAPAIFG